MLANKKTSLRENCKVRTSRNLHSVIGAGIALYPIRELRAITQLLVKQIAFVEEEHKFRLSEQLICAYEFPQLQRVIQSVYRAIF